MTIRPRVRCWAYFPSARTKIKWMAVSMVRTVITDFPVQEGPILQHGNPISSRYPDPNRIHRR